MISLKNLLNIICTEAAEELEIDRQYHIEHYGYTGWCNRRLGEERREGKDLMHLHIRGETYYHADGSMGETYNVCEKCVLDRRITIQRKEDRNE